MAAEQDIPKSWAEKMHPAHAHRFTTWLPFVRSEDRSPYHSITDGRERVNPKIFASNFRKATHFKEIDEDLVVTEYPYDVKRKLPNGELENYPEKLIEERKTGKNEAASYGIGTIGKRKFVGIIFNWEFMVASSGAVVGEKFLRAMDLATKENLPVVVLYSSGGQRQQEAAAALREMFRTTYAIKQFKKETNKPIVSVLVGDVWGGISASGVPSGDLVIGMAGTNFGFAGSIVIEATTRQKPPEGAQTVENSFLTNRNVQMILNTQDELLAVLDKAFSILDESAKPASKRRKITPSTGIDIDGYGFTTPLDSNKLTKGDRTKIQIQINHDKPETVYDQHQVLGADPRYPDTLYILRYGFDGFMPLFSGRISVERVGPLGQERFERHLRYPAVIAALAYIDDPRLSKRLRMMVIGDQPSYIERTNGTILKDHASPTAWDYRNQIRMMEFARRLRYPITSFVDTFGAKSSIEEELAGQYDAIEKCLDYLVDYPYFTRGYNIGVLGSGGGFATLMPDYIAQVAYGQEFVAVPDAATPILQKEVTTEDKRRIAEGMRPDAQSQLSLGLVDKVIPESPKGAYNDPLDLVAAIREDIILGELEYGEMTTEQILIRRDDITRKSGPIGIGHLNGKSRRRFSIHLPGH